MKKANSSILLNSVKMTELPRTDMNAAGPNPLTWRENVTDADEASQLGDALRDRAVLARNGVRCVVTECRRELVETAYRVTFTFMQIFPASAA
jgi:hypothetical protein